jgi:hypothetical protein
LGQGSQEADKVVDTRVQGPGVQLLGERPLAGDETRERGSTAGQEADGVDEHVETLLLDQAAYGDDLRATRPWHELELLEVEAVVDPVDGPGRAGEGAAKVAEVEVADRDDMVGAGQLPLEVLRVDVLVEDVLRMGGEGVGAPGQQGGDAGDAGGDGSEVRVQVVDPALLDQARQLEGLRGVLRLEGQQVVEMAPQRGMLLLSGPQQLPELDGPQPPTAQVGNRGMDLREGLVEAAVQRRAQGEDLDALALRLPRADLVDDERLREAWVDLGHVSQERLRP